MHIILDNAIFALQKIGGISIYWHELIKRIEIYKSDVRFINYKNNNIIGSISIKKTRQRKFLLRYFPIFKLDSGKALFHSSYYRVCFGRNVINFVTVHDFTYEFYRKGLAHLVHHHQKKFAIAHADAIICVSNNTKNDLLQFFPDTDHKKIKVIYNGIGNEFFPICHSQCPQLFIELINKKFVIFIGDRSKYKNFEVAIDAINLYSNLTFVVVGGKTFTDEEKKYISKLNGRFNSFIGLTSEALNWLYNNAFCLIYPSSYEGFGIPILEAMKAGCPVVSTNFSSIPEVAGDAALLVDRIEPEAFLEKIQILEDPEFRSQLIEKGLKQAAKFSWDKCFEETYAFYEEVYKRKFG